MLNRVIANRRMAGELKVTGYATPSVCSLASGLIDRRVEAAGARVVVAGLQAIGEMNPS
jgi:hypothetical protein